MITNSVNNTASRHYSSIECMYVLEVSDRKELKIGMAKLTDKDLAGTGWNINKIIESCKSNPFDNASIIQAPNLLLKNYQTNKMQSMNAFEYATLKRYYKNSELTTLQLGDVFTVIHTDMLIDVNGNPLTDHDVHNVLMNSGYHKINTIKNNRTGEFMDAPLPVIKLAVRAAKRGDTVISKASEFAALNHMNSYKDKRKLRENQLIIHDRCVKWFHNNESNGFKTNKPGYLIGAVPRYGKTFTSMNIAKTLNWKKILIITHRPNVIDSWHKDSDLVMDNTEHHKHEFISEKTGNWNKHTDYNEFTAFISMQDARETFAMNDDGSLKTDEKGNPVIDKQKNAWLFDGSTRFDGVLIDEGHEGTRTELADNVLNAIRKSSPDSAFIWLTGTPLRVAGMFDDESSSYYDYYDERMDAMKWDEKVKSGEAKFNPYAELPEMVFMHYSMNENKNGNTPMNELLAAHAAGNSKYAFDNPQAVESLFHRLNDSSSDTMFPYSGNNRDDFRYTMITVPSVASAKALESLLKTMDGYDNYDILNISGNDNKEFNSSTVEANVNKHINDCNHDDNHYDGVIIITVDKATVGTTIPGINAVIDMTDSTDASVCWQRYCRAKTPCHYDKHGWIINDDNESNESHAKTQCFIFDMNPNRQYVVLNGIVNHHNNHCDDDNERNENKQNIDDTMADAFTVYGSDGDCMKRIESNDLVKSIRNALNENAMRSILGANGISTAFINAVNMNALLSAPTNDAYRELMTAFMNVNERKNRNVSTRTANKHGRNAGKTTKQQTNKTANKTVSGGNTGSSTSVMSTDDFNKAMLNILRMIPLIMLASMSTCNAFKNSEPTHADIWNGCDKKIRIAVMNDYNVNTAYDKHMQQAIIKYTDNSIVDSWLQTLWESFKRALDYNAVSVMEFYHTINNALDRFIGSGTQVFTPLNTVFNHLKRTIGVVDINNLTSEFTGNIIKPDGIISMNNSNDDKIDNNDASVNDNSDSESNESSANIDWLHDSILEIGAKDSRYAMLAIITRIIALFNDDKINGIIECDDFNELPNEKQWCYWHRAVAGETIGKHCEQSDSINNRTHHGVYVLAANASSAFIARTILNGARIMDANELDEHVSYVNIPSIMKIMLKCDETGIRKLLSYAFTDFKDIHNKLDIMAKSWDSTLRNVVKDNNGQQLISYTMNDGFIIHDYTRIDKNGNVIMDKKTGKPKIAKASDKAVKQSINDYIVSIPVSDDAPLFDVAVGNPPYNTKEHNKTENIYQFFYLASREIARIVDMVFMVGWRTSSGKASGSGGHDIMRADTGIIMVDDYPSNEMFPGAGLPDKVNIVVRDDSYDNNGLISFYDNGVFIDSKDISSELSYMDDADKQIIKKVDSITGFRPVSDRITGRNPFGIRGYLTTDSTREAYNHIVKTGSGIKSWMRNKDNSDYDFWIIPEGLKDYDNSIKAYVPAFSDKLNIFGSYKVLLPKSGAYRMGRDAGILLPNEACCDSFIVSAFATKDTCNNFVSYINTNLFIYILDKTARDSNILSNTYRFIPDLSSTVNPRTGKTGYDSDWTDDDLKTVFAGILTDDDWIYIKSHVPDCPPARNIMKPAGR